jgi:hypothetical protein
MDQRERPKQRRDLPRTMTKEAWAILAQQEGERETKRKEGYAKLQAAEQAKREELGETGYKALKNARARARRAKKGGKKSRRRVRHY